MGTICKVQFSILETKCSLQNVGLKGPFNLLHTAVFVGQGLRIAVASKDSHSERSRASHPKLD